jgi:hypothetical protein
MMKIQTLLVCALFLFRLTYAQVGFQEHIIDRQSPGISIYPNPAAGIVNVSFPVLKIEVYNQAGQLLKTSEKSATINISDLPRAFYIIKLTTGEGKQISCKIEKK